MTRLLRIFQEAPDEPDDREGYNNGRVGRDLAIGWIRQREHARLSTVDLRGFQFPLGAGEGNPRPPKCIDCFYEVVGAVSRRVN
ncbi:MAG: hypothetical protein EOP84_02240 [Verrucomicrobiaceae bacterium]|nr:MAG: hypothetical protein EOP84_02240 [Verrucomicrobiaceae bacterium]